MPTRSPFRYLFLIFFVLCTVCQSVQAAPMRLAMLLEHESFLMWYAKERGWDQELGLQVDLQISNSTGADLLQKQEHDPEGWDVTAVGAVPAVIYSKDVPLTVVALANNESRATEIFVRGDSDILKTQGFNSAYPNVFGSPETVRGKTFLVREHTSTFYTLMTWVRLLGLDFSEIKYEDVMPSEAVQSMYTGNAHGVVLWSPNSYDALRLGYTKVANAEDVHAFVPILFLSQPEYAKNHAEELSKLIAIYLRACAEQRSNLETLIPEYQKFLKVFTGRNYDADFCKFDLLRHRVFTLDEQLDYFRKVNGRSKLSEAKLQILSLFNEVAAELNHSETYDAQSYLVSSTDEYLHRSREYIK